MCDDSPARAALLFPLFLNSLAPFKKAPCALPPVSLGSAVKCERVAKLLDLGRYKFALSARAPPFYDNASELVETAARWKVMSERDGDSWPLTAQGDRCGNRARAYSRSNSERCFTEAIVFHTHVYV